MSGSSTASSDTSMTGRVPSEEEVIANAGVADGSAAGDVASMNPPTGRSEGGQAVQLHTPKSDLLFGSGETSPNDHPHARDRKRRLTSNSDTSRLQRTRSGGAIQPEANAQPALPHRSVSMVLPSSRSTSPNAPGSSYATAIDIASSPSDDGRYVSIDPAGSVHGQFAGSSSYRAPSNCSHASDSGSHPSRIASRYQSDSRFVGPRHVSLSSGASSTSRTAEAPNDRPGYQTWSPSLVTNAELDLIIESHRKSHQSIPSEPQSRRSSQASSGAAWESHAEGNSHRGLAGQYRDSRYSNRGPDNTRSMVASITGVESDGFQTYQRASTLNSPGVPDNRDGNIESFGWRPERRGIDGNSPERRVFSASSGEPSRSRANTDERRFGRYPEYQDIDLPRWQPDAEVTNCPICGTVFSFWYRKHHCRKCGRVVCASCSPHSIVIPRQFIVRPPDTPTSPSLTSPPSHTPVVDLTVDDSTPFDSLNSPINPALGGGEKVRLCNPCVPDPNPNPLGYGSPRAHGHRSTHSLTSSPTSSMGQLFSRPAREEASSRQERRTVGANDRPSVLQGLGQPARRSVSGAMASFGNRSRMASTTSVADLSAAAFAPPRDTQVSEEDLCPVCTRRFPPLSNEHTQDAREAHVRECIASYGASPVHREPQHLDIRRPPPPPRPSPAAARMLPFTATEKDCLAEDGSVAECTICMEEYEVGDSLARLNCFCKFHKWCIMGWFEQKPVCPTHQG